MTTKFSNIIYLLFFSLNVISCGGIQDSVSNDTVYFIPTLHKYHQQNDNYNYDSLTNIISRINPDIIAVEVRNIDISEDSTLLSKFYPHEFVMMKTQFPEKTIVGFDWWASHAEGVKVSEIPQNFFADLPSKKQWKQLQQDSLTLKKLAGCFELQKERVELIKNLSLNQFLKSKDGELVIDYYKCLKENLQDTPYDEVVKSTEERDRKILENIKTIIAQNRNKKIIILAGDDHFQMLKDKFKNRQP